MRRKQVVKTRQLKDIQYNPAWEKVLSITKDQSDNSIQNKAMENGSLDNPEYYMQEVQNQITVGRYIPKK